MKLKFQGKEFLGELKKDLEQYKKNIVKNNSIINKEQVRGIILVLWFVGLPFVAGYLYHYSSLSVLLIFLLYLFGWEDIKK